MLYDLVRPAMFQLSADDPERAHEWVIRLLALPSNVPGASRLPRAQTPRLSQSLFGLRFPNPVGLAAGFDKNAVAVRALLALGFGFVEAGTVTLHPQHGNPRPRIVRLPAQQALINRMGFNNDGRQPRAASRVGGAGRVSSAAMSARTGPRGSAAACAAAAASALTSAISSSASLRWLRPACVPCGAERSSPVCWMQRGRA
jgi:hypothetical protein